MSPERALAASSLFAALGMLAVAAPATASDRDILKVVAGPWHSCALTSDGALYCWDVVFPDRRFRPDPKRVELPPLTDFDMGTQGLSCGIERDGSPLCWHAYFEAAADGYKPSSVHQPSPFSMPIAAGHPLQRIAVGFSHVCGLDADGGLWCAGNNAHGEVGTGDTESQMEMLKVAGLPPVVSFDTGINNTCSVSRAGEAWCWGTDSPVANRPMIVNSLVPAKVSGPAHLVEVQDGRNAMCATSSDPAVYCWGDDIMAQLGVAQWRMRGRLFAVVKQELDQPVKSISSGMFNTCIVLQDGGVRCWGTWGSVADGDATKVYEPRTEALPGPASSVSVSADDDKACAVLDDDSIWCWGSKQGIGGSVDDKPLHADEPWQVTLPPHDR